MKKNYSIALILPVFLTLCVHLSAQESTEEPEAPAPSYFKFKTSYLNDNVYLGRKDSLKIPYLSATISYYHKSGIFLSSSLSYLPASGENRIDDISFEGGYAFTLHKLEGEFSLSKDFYNTQSHNVKSEVSASSSASLGYDLGIIKPSLGGGISFGNKNDYTMNGGLEHSFSVADDHLSITPTFSFNASTQNYYNSYYQKRRYAKTKKGKIVPYQITANALNVTKFKIMDYELSLPLEYGWDKLTFNFSPTLAIPTNPNEVILTIKPDSGPSYSKQYTEHLSTVFFWSFELSYKF